MKNIMKSLLLALAVGLAAVACDNEPTDSTAQPVIKYIRSTEAEKSDSLITSAAMGQTIAIIGSGLEGVVKACFNDQEAKLNPVYVTEHSIICTVPNTMPAEVTNTLTLTTGKGKSCVYDFAVAIPRPAPSSISCEWAADGATATIYGRYFFARESGGIDVLFPGNLSAAVQSFDETSITVTVPEGSLSGVISVSNDYGTGRSSFVFRDQTGIIIDGDNLSAWDNWNYSGNFVRDDAESLAGNYIFFTGSSASWNWNTNGLALYFFNVDADGNVITPLIEDGDDPMSYSLKFEANIKAWKDVPMLIWFTGLYNTFSCDGDEAQYHWKPYLDAGGAETDGWVTVTVPLSEFVQDKEETVTSRKISAGDMGSLCMFWFGALSDESNNGSPIEVYVDNIRVVKTK